MDPRIIAALLANRRIAYATCDAALIVTALADPEGLFGRAGPLAPGASLLDLAPELVGSEADLEDILAGRRARLDFELLSHEDSRGRPVYVHSLVVRAGECEGGLGCGLAYMMEDVTALGENRQRLTQSRNDLLLAQRELARTILDLEIANAELRRLTDLKSVFLSVAAHELRTPLAIIVSYADLMMNGLIGARDNGQVASLRTIRAAAFRLLGITDNLLELTRMEAGRLEMVLQVLDLGDLVAGTVAEHQHLYADAGVQIMTFIEPDLPLALLDELRAAQIVANLLSNARKYTPPGGVVRVALGRTTDPAELLLTVSDTGVGIAPEDQPRVGTWLFRAQTANTISAGGVGLGLYITRSLVELHGGRFWFESCPGAGSEFHVTFLAAGGEAG